MLTDRRVAGGVVALAVVVLAVTIAATLGTITPNGAPHEDERTIARELLLLAHRADGRSYRIDYMLTRRIGGRAVLRSSLTMWVRAHPPLTVESSNGTVTVDSARGTWVCTPVTGTPQCLASRTGLPASQSAAAPYAVALATGRYTVARGSDRTIARLDARCFVLHVEAGVDPIVGLGDELAVCFAPTGLLLLSQRTEGTTTDARTATAVRAGVSTAELRALARTSTDGSVPDLPSR